MLQKIKVDYCPQHGSPLPCYKCGLTSKDILTKEEYTNALDIMQFKVKHYKDEELKIIWQAATNATKMDSNSGYQLLVNNRRVIINWEAWLASLHSEMLNRNLSIR